MHKDYASSPNNRLIFSTCLATFWPTKHYHIKQRFPLPKHILEDNLRYTRVPTQVLYNMPSSNRFQTKVVNKVLVHALRTHFGCNKQWDYYLHILQHSYNKATHSSIRFSSFEVFLGFQLGSLAEIPLALAPQGTIH